MERPAAASIDSLLSQSSHLTHFPEFILWKDQSEKWVHLVNFPLVFPSRETGLKKKKSHPKSRVKEWGCRGKDSFLFFLAWTGSRGGYSNESQAGVWNAWCCCAPKGRGSPILFIRSPWKSMICLSVPLPTSFWDFVMFRGKISSKWEVETPPQLIRC